MLHFLDNILTTHGLWAIYTIVLLHFKRGQSLARKPLSFQNSVCILKWSINVEHYSAPPQSQLSGVAKSVNSYSFLVLVFFFANKRTVITS